MNGDMRHRILWGGIEMKHTRAVWTIIMAPNYCAPLFVPLLGISVGNITNESVGSDLSERINRQTTNYKIVPLSGDYSSAKKIKEKDNIFYSIFFNNCATYVGGIIAQNGSSEYKEAVKYQFIPDQMIKRIIKIHS